MSTRESKQRKRNVVSSGLGIIENKNNLCLRYHIVLDKSMFVTVMDEAVLRHLQSRLVGRGSQHK